MEGHAESKIQLLRRHIHAFPDFPKKGILFRDICPILKDPSALTAVIDLFEEHVKNENWEVDLIVGLDARGFLFGPLLAQRLGVGFVMVRKKGKLPGATVCVAYDLEYGKAEAEIQEDAVTPGQKVVLLDDLLATGGTLFAACELLKKQDAEIQGCMVVIELTELKDVDQWLRSSPATVWDLGSRPRLDHPSTSPGLTAAVSLSKTLIPPNAPRALQLPPAPVCSTNVCMCSL
ncbi:adenine phosphoribosyltransferase [Phycodurus eques]|uniref:adenine phosphoribosyltransferase n=1 Tax=Phycodurus eques TaxID=693459 RepID=UPI002ACE0846|nr:adenine phosphoribosyltransferase [Phycodurus eques]